MNEIIETNCQIAKTNSHYFADKSKKILILVNALRLVSADLFIKNQTLIIPNNCEKYGFSKGYHNLSQMLHFFADMLEE
jgi:hypothetical protein